MDAKKILDNMKVSAVVARPDFGIAYVNQRGEELFKAAMDAENLVGTDLRGYHTPQTNEKLEKLFEDYRQKEKTLHYYVKETATGKATIVNVPIYEGEEFAGVIEFIFESALDAV